MPFPDHMLGNLHKSAETEVDTFRAAEAISAGDPLQRATADEDEVEVFDDTGEEFVGIALDSMRADQDAGPPHTYAENDPVPVLRPGSLGQPVVPFEEDGAKGEGVVIDPATSTFRPESTATTPVVALTNAEIAVPPGGAQDNGAIRLRPTET